MGHLYFIVFYDDGMLFISQFRLRIWIESRRKSVLRNGIGEFQIVDNRIFAFYLVEYIGS